MKAFAVVLFLCLLGMSASPARADVPNLMTVQGRLTDVSDVILPDGTYSIRFRVYDDEFAGNVIWESTTPVPVNGGLFTVSLAIPDTVFNSPNRWLGIKVDLNPEGTPRQRLTSVGYAHRSGQWSSLGDNIHRAIGNIGVGTSTPLRRFHVYDGPGNPTVARFEGTSSSTTVVEFSNTSSGTVWEQGVTGNVSSLTPGSMYFYRQGSSVLPFMINQNDQVGMGTNTPFRRLHVYDGSGTQHRVARFETNNTTASVVELGNTNNNHVWEWGVAGSSAGIPPSGSMYFYHLGSAEAPFVISPYGSNFIGIGEPFPACRLHVHGETDPIVARFENSSSVATVIEVLNTNNVFSAHWQLGVGGPDASVGNRSFYINRVGGGLPLIIDQDGRVGIGNLPPFFAALDVEAPGGGGISSTASGSFVNALSGYATGPSSWGVYGTGTEWAGYFTGNVRVTGAINLAAVSSTVDHPLDPANKSLTHSGVESPDMKNIYDGVVVTDANGNATVTMPDWFEAANRDFRYQLTVIGEFAQAIVSEEMAGNRFSIKTDKPNVKVSWQVTGIRQDAYANAHRAPVEELKPVKERGFYIHPELFDQPEEKGVTWAQRPEMMKQMKERREKATATSTPPQ
jgi:hypothetical protein